MTVAVARLPRHDVVPGTELFRIHRAINAPWFFSTDGSGRYDPVERAGTGACYWAEDPLGSWAETFRTVMTIAEADVERRRISTLVTARPLRLVDLTKRPALAAGVTTALTGGATYGPAQELASALVGVVDGVRWRIRHDPEQALTAVALFGPAGANDPAVGRVRTEPLTADLVREAEDAFGYRVVPIP